jgi:hypothetical protein
MFLRKNLVKLMHTWDFYISQCNSYWYFFSSLYKSCLHTYQDYIHISMTYFIVANRICLVCPKQTMYQNFVKYWRWPYFIFCKYGIFHIMAYWSGKIYIVAIQDVAPNGNIRRRKMYKHCSVFLLEHRKCLSIISYMMNSETPCTV